MGSQSQLLEVKTFGSPACFGKPLKPQFYDSEIEPDEPSDLEMGDVSLVCPLVNSREFDTEDFRNLVGSKQRVHQAAP